MARPSGGMRVGAPWPMVPNMERAMPAEPLLTWYVVMPPLHDGKLPEAAETEAQ